MTNAMIVLVESVKLMEDGVIGGSGIKGMVPDADGNEKEIELPEAIHTFQTWKKLGYQVKKGEKAVAKFPIWKHTAAKHNDEGEEEKPSRMFMKTAAWFTISQCEVIAQ